jgi:hypothetical protein
VDEIVRGVQSAHAETASERVRTLPLRMAVVELMLVRPRRLQLWTQEAMNSPLCQFPGCSYHAYMSGFRG